MLNPRQRFERKIGKIITLLNECGNEDILLNIKEAQILEVAVRTALDNAVERMTKKTETFKLEG